MILSFITSTYDIPKEYKEIFSAYITELKTKQKPCTEH